MQVWGCHRMWGLRVGVRAEVWLRMWGLWVAGRVAAWLRMWRRRGGVRV